jgi:hypothetical protein
MSKHYSQYEVKVRTLGAGVSNVNVNGAGQRCSEICPVIL